jgi:hypothetical protein
MMAAYQRTMAAMLVVSLTPMPSALAQTPTVPAPRFHHSGVYDEARDEFLIYGGFVYDQQPKAAGDVWGWNGSSWKLVGDTGVRKFVASLSFDSKRQRTLMFGGADNDKVSDGKLSSLEGKTWQLVKDAPILARADASLAYDSQRDRLVLFGGRSNKVLYADTWEFDGNEWKPTFMAGPSLRSAGAVAYDSDRGVTVLYGGFRPLAALGDTWEWNGEQWKLASETGPGPRS